jgi:hypothetical protein
MQSVAGPDAGLSVQSVFLAGRVGQTLQSQAGTATHGRATRGPSHVDRASVCRDGEGARRRGAD